MFAALVAPLPAYDIQLIYSTPKTDWGRPYATATVLTESNLVAGYYCESTGHHGETTLAKPFVIHKGKVTYLPLGKAEFGQVLAGNDRALVGWTEPYDTPVKWTPHKTLGWAKATLSIIDRKNGQAVSISPKGDIMIAGRTDVRRVGPSGNRTWKPKDFRPIEIDSRGTIWGYTFTGFMFGGSHTGLSVVQLTHSGPKVITPKFAPTDFNSRGDYCGDSLVDPNQGKDIQVSPTFEQKIPAVSLSGKITKIPLPNFRYGWATGMNDHGHVVGCYYKTVNRADSIGQGYIYAKGKVEILPPPSIGVTHLEPSRINNTGVIVGSGDFQCTVRLYLYKPKGR